MESREEIFIKNFQPRDVIEREYFDIQFKNAMSEYAEQEAVGFAEWMSSERYSIYFGNEGENCGKWYKQYSDPNRTYYTTPELYAIYRKEKGDGK